ncbi:MAG TPA: glycoside hydrolase family 43 protein [Pyrinomonadaceae bacterium]|nr:glycoside hydrolase family 43 protein [Pyrinomonadaceae bacterium]
MPASRERTERATYLNPVYERSFPDPFVLKFGGHYYAYSTGFADNGSVFSVIRSKDLVHWSDSGGAMKPLEPTPPYYWAPEVTYSEGKFYLYYSVGNETFMELRVAVSDRPDGGFIDAGHKLTSEDFAIDAHVFTDDDGHRYMFYATDFLEHSHIGTGTVVDRMLDWFSLEGKPQPVTRARFDWQVYDPVRKEKGGVRWHTVEGPSVLKRKNVYYEMFSGGNWQNTSYGVSFAVSPSIRSTSEWLQFSDGENALPIMRTIPDTVIGPGHNSIVRGPNNRELYCVYHRWVGDQRVMAIDRMDFAGDRIFVVGPTHSPQPVPFEPNIVTDLGGVEPDLSGGAELAIATETESYLCEFDIEPVTTVGESGSWGISVITGAKSRTDFPFGRRSVEVVSDNGQRRLTLPSDFCSTASHHVRLEVDCRRISLSLDDIQICRNELLDAPVASTSLFSVNQRFRIGEIQITDGFEELFESDEALEANGWRVAGADLYTIAGGELSVAGTGKFVACKGPAYADVEFAANFRSAKEDIGGSFGLIVRWAESDDFRLGIDRLRNTLLIGDSIGSLPSGVRLDQYHQLRIVKQDNRATAYLDDARLGEFDITPGEVTCAVYADHAAVAIEMVRLTSI